MLALLPSDIFLLVFAGLLVVFTVWAARQQYYREAARRLKGNWLALFCLLIVFGYGCTAFFDSIHYKPKISTEGNEATYGERISVLDVLILKVYDGVYYQDGRIIADDEKSYSSPLADQAFNREQDRTSGVWARPDLQHPGTHLLGTDKAGGDVLYKLLKGIRTALLVGLVTTMIVIPFAIAFGVMAGYFGGKIDDIIQFVYITLGSIPSILLISGMMMIVTTKVTAVSADDVAKRDDLIVIYLCVILGLVGWSGLCRLLRAETIKLRELDYVKAAQAMGASHLHVIFKHIIPNLIHVVLISSILRFSGLVMVEAILAYIKIGVPSTVQSWGRIVDGARDQLARDPVIWWPVAGAFIFMFILVLAINIAGDAVRDALDPKLRT